MTHDEVQTLITDGLVSTFQLERSRITLDATLYNDLELDSIDTVDLAAKLQSQTGVRLAPQDFKSVSTVADLIAALHGPLNSRTPDAVVSIGTAAQIRHERDQDEETS